MSSFGQVPLKDVWAMLQACAPGHTVTTTKHHHCIRYKGLTYPAFPKGAHGASNPSIEKGHIKKMARHFGILKCAQEFLSL